MSFAASFARSPIKSIQAISISVGGTSSNTQTVTAVDTAKSFLVFTGFRDTNTETYVAATYGTGYHSISMVLTNSTTVTATVGSSQPLFSLIITGYLVEFY